MLPIRTQHEGQAYKPSVLIAGWKDLGDNPFRRKVEEYGCTTVHAPSDSTHIPKCDMVILVSKVAGQAFSSRVKEHYGMWRRPIIYAPSGFESCREQFEAALDVVAEARAKQLPTPAPIRRAEPTEEKVAQVRTEAEKRIQEREKEANVVINRVHIEPAPTVDSVIRAGYGEKKSPDAIAAELNAKGFLTPSRNKPWRGNTVSYHAAQIGCARKGKGKAVAPGVTRDDVIARLLAAKLPPEQKLAYIERAHRGDIISLIDAGCRRDDKGALVLWRTPILEPENGVTFRITKAQACLVADYLSQVREFAEESEE